MIRRPPRSTHCISSAASDVYKRQQYDQSAEQSLKALELEPEFAPAQYTLGLAYEQMGEVEDAVRVLQRARDGSESNPATLAGLGHAYAVSGQKDEAAKILDTLNSFSKHAYVSPYAFAIVYAGLCDHDRGFESLESAYRERDVWLVWLKREPRFDCLRSDARFENLLSRIGFPA